MDTNEYTIKLTRNEKDTMEQALLLASTMRGDEDRPLLRHDLIRTLIEKVENARPMVTMKN